MMVCLLHRPIDLSSLDLAVGDYAHVRYEGVRIIGLTDVEMLFREFATGGEDDRVED